MNEPLENLYFNWLCSKICHVDVPTPSNTYWTLLRTLQATEYIWLISGDDNRAEDGLELRVEFLHAADIPDHPEWRHLPCSVLEMLIAFARRTSFQTSDTVERWFWTFINNLGLGDFNDANAHDPDLIVESIQDFLWRTYGKDGRGGLFPLTRAKRDQREVEIWYQFYDYLKDQNLMP